MRSAIRSLVVTPTATLATIGTIALGIGATSAMFSVVYSVLLRPLPYQDAERLVMVWEKWQVERDMKGVDPLVAARLAERSPVITSGLEVWRKGNHVFEGIAAFSPLDASLSGDRGPERVHALAVSSSLFGVLGISPALGREFSPNEDIPGEDSVVVLSDAIWRRSFEGDPEILGKPLRVDGRPHTIIGVMPRGFRFLLPEIGGDPDVILPLPHSYAPDRRWSLVMTVARLREGVTVGAAQDDMSALVRRMAESNPRYRTRDANVVQLRDEIDRDSRFSILVLSGATACLLIIVCLNVANLLLVRAAGRRRELAIRTALGAGRWRLTRHVIAESVALACAGGSAGLALAYWATAALTTVVPDDIVPRIADVHVDPVVFAFGLGVSLSVGAIVSIGPAWHTLRWDRRGTLNRLLADNPRASSAGRGERAMRRILVAVQVAAAVVLLVGAGLLTETYIRLTRVDLGIDPDRVLTFGLTLPPARYASPESIVALADALVTRLEALPGVREVGLTNSLPVQPQMLASMTVQAEGQPPSDRHEAVDVRTVTPGFFRAGGIRTAYGRVLTPVDATKDVVVVNRTLVRRFWPSAPFMGPEPLGRRLLVGSRWCTIVGVVDDVKYSAPDGPAEQEAYVPLSFWPVGYVSALVRSSGDPTQLADLARHVVRAIDPELPVQDVRTMGMVVSESIAAQRLRFVLAGVFAAVALALALVGLYGVIAQSVAQRAREIGIRMALGASRPRIARMVLADALAVALIGTAAGVAISMAVTRLLATFLFGVSAIHLPTYAMVAAATLMLSGAAVWAPAWSAMRSDPASILRDT